MQLILCTALCPYNHGLIFFFFLTYFFLNQLLWYCLLSVLAIIFNTFTKGLHWILIFSLVPKKKKYEYLPVLTVSGLICCLILTLVIILSRLYVHVLDKVETWNHKLFPKQCMSNSIVAFCLQWVTKDSFCLTGEASHCPVVDLNDVDIMFHAFSWHTQI